MDIRNPKDGQDHARKTGAATEIDQTSGTIGKQRKELCRIKHMPVPEIIEGRAPNQVDPTLPFAEKGRVVGEAFQSLT